MKILIFALVLLALPVCVSAGTDQQLFIIERTTNGSIVHYDARIDAAGHLDSREPVVAYWTIGSVNGKREPLNFIERTRAYGFNIKKTSPGRYVMTVVSQKQIEIEVYEEAGAVRAEAFIGGRRAYLQKIFANIEGAFWPKVNYVELFGTDVLTGVLCYQKVLPNQ